jgi:hypothetical protein
MEEAMVLSAGSSFSSHAILGSFFASKKKQGVWSITAEILVRDSVGGIGIARKR